MGVFPHGENSREMILMAEYGMPNLDVLCSATSINARIFGLINLGNVRQGFLADLIAVEGNPVDDIKLVKKVTFVMKGGVILKQ